MDVKPNILVDQRNSMIFHHMRNIITNRRVTTKLDPNYSYSYEEKEVIRVWERRGVFLEFSVARRVKICTDREFAPTPPLPRFRREGNARAWPSAFRRSIDTRATRRQATLSRNIHAESERMTRVID